MADSQKIREILDSDIGYIIKVCALTVSVVMFIILPQKEMEKALALQAKDISVISANHLTHIQDSIKIIEAEIKNIKSKEEERSILFARHEIMLEEVLKILKK
jgi:hypothetical protein